jgi:hypothetical protein
MRSVPVGGWSSARTGKREYPVAANELLDLRRGDIRFDGYEVRQRQSDDVGHGFFEGEGAGEQGAAARRVVGDCRVRGTDIRSTLSAESEDLASSGR